MNWYDKYCGFPYKHLGEDIKEGIDCFNLIKYIYKQERNIIIPYTTSDFCDIIDENWYNKTNKQFIKEAASEEYGWIEVKEPELYDVITMSIGATNVINHCSMYVGNNRMIQTMLDHTSWITLYGNYYKQYTNKIVRYKE